MGEKIRHVELIIRAFEQEYLTMRRFIRYIN